MGKGWEFGRDDWIFYIRPDKLKLLVFILLLILTVMLPLYPAHHKIIGRHDTYGFNGASYKRITFLEPLYVVMIENFEWVEVTADDASPYGYMQLRIIEASPIFLIIYVNCIILAYILACYFIESHRWKRERNHLWKY